jgi:hypothetical protein
MFNIPTMPPGFGAAASCAERLFINERMKYIKPP